MLYILAILAAFSLSAFQYLYKRKALWLFIVRFLVYLSLLILLINPKWIRKKEIVTKPDLYVLADNSSSVKWQNASKFLIDFLREIKQSKLKDKFRIHYFKFDKAISSLDSLSFSGKQTAIGDALSELKMMHQSDNNAAIILLSDGQNNAGRDYVYQSSLSKSFKVYPVVLGDTTTYDDLRIDLVNTNAYVYKDNYFPVEIFLTADLHQPVKARLNILEQGKILFQKKIDLNPAQSSAHITAKLKSGKVGLHRYRVSVSGLKNEKNTLNNRQYFSVEVLNNARKVLLISDIIHPDIGAIRRSLKTHPATELVIKKPTDKFQLSDYQSVILYQPVNTFVSVFKQLKQQHKSWWIITGKHTDWNFLNRQNLFFSRQIVQSYENYFPIKNPGFGLFKLPDLSLDKLSPLIDNYGQVKLSSATETAYFSRINNIAIQQPLLVFNTEDKQVVLLGENLWQWAMISGVSDTQQAFDQLLFQIVQYINLNNDFERLQLQYKKQFYQSMPVMITAKFLDRNLEPDTNVSPEFMLYTAHKIVRYPMLLQNDFYQVNLPDLPAGFYRFKVQNKDGSLQKNGSFRILPFSLEKQNLQANVKGLKQLAQQTGGQLYYPNQTGSLADDLMSSKQFHSTMAYETSETPLIDYRPLLFLIVLLLTIEWLVKKLRGEL